MKLFNDEIFTLRKELEYPEIGDDPRDLWYFDDGEKEDDEEEETKFVKQLFENEKVRVRETITGI